MLNLGLTWAILVPAMLAARLRFSPRALRTPWLTLCVLLLLAAALAAQLAWPDLLTLFERDAWAIRQGAAHRLFTALWFQDGWLGGGIFNLTMCAVIGTLAEQYWRRPAWLCIYFGVGLGIEFLGIWWQPIGAGNSIAVFGLAGSLLTPSVESERPRLLTGVQAIGLLAALGLLLKTDIHGAAALLGVGAGFLLRQFPAMRNQARAEEFPAA